MAIKAKFNRIFKNIYFLEMNIANEELATFSATSNKNDEVMDLNANGD